MKKKENIKITKNIIELLKIIDEFRYLPIKSLIEILKIKGFYNTRASLTRITILLEKKELIRSFVYGNNWKVIYLTRKGANLLADSLGLDRHTFLPPNQGFRLKYAGLEHTVSIVNLYLELLKSFEITKWLGDQKILCRYEFRSNKTSKTLRSYLTPDGYFEFNFNNHVYSFFLEYDTGSMDGQQLSKKFKRYFEYYLYGDWKDRFEKFPNIFFLTERAEKSMRRLISFESLDLNKALINREYFTKTSNILWKAISISENLRSTNSQLIKEFFSLKFIFSYTNVQWIEYLKQQLQ